ncbi:MAG: hypothetical protein R3F39_13910 [Myxococcota bacterium]
MGRLIGVCALVALMASGCVRQVRDLTRAEAAALGAVQARVAQNREPLTRSLADLGRVSQAALGEKDGLTSGVAKAQLLESMRSPWVTSQGAGAATSREVALYHLYALADAERELRSARIRQREARLAAVQEAYDRLVGLTADAVAAETLILRYLEQPRGARVAEAVDGFLAETRAFRDVIQSSENPEMRRLADQVTRGEDAVRQAKEFIELAIDKARTLKEKP